MHPLQPAWVAFVSFAAGQGVSCSRVWQGCGSTRPAHLCTPPPFSAPPPPSPHAAFSPPTVSDTKKAFSDAYKRPIPALYNTVVQELLVQQHFIRYSVNYKYNAVSVRGRGRG